MGKMLDMMMMLVPGGEERTPRIRGAARTERLPGRARGADGLGGQRGRGGAGLARAGLGIDQFRRDAVADQDFAGTRDRLAPGRRRLAAQEGPEVGADGAALDEVVVPDQAAVLGLAADVRQWRAARSARQVAIGQRPALLGDVVAAVGAAEARVPMRIARDSQGEIALRDIDQDLALRAAATTGATRLRSRAASGRGRYRAKRARSGRSCGPWRDPRDRAARPRARPPLHPCCARPA